VNENNAGWLKSSRSMANGNCIEVQPVWRKATISMTNGACVEVATITTSPSRA
jgi:hypothetical protein